MHRIAQHANTCDVDFNGIAGDEWTDSGGSAGGDQIAGIKSHHARNPADEESRGINHKRSIAGLAALPIHKAFDENVSGIESSFDVGADWAERVETFRTGKLDITFLPVEGSDNVEASVTETAALLYLVGGRSVF